jgi:hypothetical protein
MARTLGGLLVVSTIMFLAFSLPRRGKLARYVGTPWESFIVLGAVGALAIGFMLMLFGMPHFLKA